MLTSYIPLSLTQGVAGVDVLEESIGEDMSRQGLYVAQTLYCRVQEARVT